MIYFYHHEQPQEKEKRPQSVCKGTHFIIKIGETVNERIQIEFLPPSSLIPYEGNPRVHSDAQIEKLVASVREYGVVLPILIDENNVIISHHAVVAACLKLELAEIPCVRASHLTEAQKRAYILVDNRLAEDSAWDKAMLKTEMLKA